MHYIPLALLTGSDAKPSRLRVARVETVGGYTQYPVLDLWLTEGDLKELKGVVEHKGNNWVFYGYSWLPIVSINNTIIKDGIIVTGGAGTCRRVFDARGNNKLYPCGKLQAKVQEDSDKKLFCNYDYDSYPDIQPLSPLTRYRLPDEWLSIDLQNAYSTMNPSIAFHEGIVKLSNEFFQTKTIMFPETWQCIEASRITSNVEEIVCPKMMNRLHLYLQDVPRLKSLVLPEEICSGVYITEHFNFAISIHNNECLEELILPAHVSTNFTVFLENCTALKAVKQLPQRKGVKSDGVSLSAKNCPNLRVIDTPYYAYVELDVSEQCDIQKFRCQSRTFAMCKPKFRSGNYPDIAGLHS